MAIVTSICETFLRELTIAEHNFTNGTGDDFRFALYANTATLDSTTTQYTVTDEISGTGYAAGGKLAVSNTPVIDTGVTIIDFEDVIWAGSTITARGALLYNDSHPTDAAVAVWDFGSDKVSSAGDFALQMPTADALNGLLRLA